MDETITNQEQNNNKKISKSLLAEYIVFGITLACFIFAPIYYLCTSLGTDGFLLGILQRLGMIVLIFSNI